MDLQKNNSVYTNKTIKIFVHNFLNRFVIFSWILTSKNLCQICETIFEGLLLDLKI